MLLRIQSEGSLSHLQSKKLLHTFTQHTHTLSGDAGAEDEHTLTFCHLSQPICLAYNRESGEMHYKGCVKSFPRFVWVVCVMRFPRWRDVWLAQRDASTKREEGGGDGNFKSGFLWGIAPKEPGNRVSRFLMYFRLISPGLHGAWQHTLEILFFNLWCADVQTEG